MADKMRGDGWDEAPPDSVAAIKAIDPLAHGRGTREAEQRPDGNPPPEVMAEFINEAKDEGCTCNPPKVLVHKSAQGGGAISLRHESACPLIQRLDAEAEAEEAKDR